MRARGTAAVAFVRFATRSGGDEASTESIVPPICQSRCSFPIVPPPDGRTPSRSRRKALALATPEQLARQTIDALLTAAGWALQDRDQFDRNAALGVAVREFPLLAGPCDYLLFIDGRAAGVIEAKKRGSTGCLLVTLARDRTWKHPDSGARIGLSELKTLLCDEAERIMSRMGRVVSVAVHVLDLREPSSGDSKNPSG